MMMSKTQANSGFTLIELMVTLILAAVLLAWGVPSFQGFMERTTLTSETNTWVGVINAARNEAVTRGERVTICRTQNPNGCDGSSNCNCGVTEAPGSPPNYHSGYLVFTSTGNTGTLNFRPTQGNELIRAGRAQSDRVTIRGNNQGNNAFSFMPDGTLHPDDVEPNTARHVICVADNGADLAASQNSEQVGMESVRVVVIAPTGRPRVAGGKELDDASMLPTDCQGSDGDALDD